MPKKSKNKNKIGAWAFLIGVILAVVLGVFGLSDALVGLLVIIGILVGLFNVTQEEGKDFLLASIALVIVAYAGGSALSALGSVALVGRAIQGILNALLMLFVPTTIIVALRSLFAIAKD